MLANPRNWRIHPKAQQDVLKGVLAQIGWVQDVIVNQRTGFVVDGHARVALAISAGERVPVVYVDLSDEEEAAILATLDPISAMAGKDEAIFGELTAGMDEAFKALVDATAPPVTNCAPVDGEDDVPDVPIAPVTVLGDLWLLGEHRVLCGDSTSVDSVARLMDGEKPDMVYTDPPYGIDVVRFGTIGGSKPFGKNGFDGVIKAGVYAPIIGDDSIETALAAFSVCETLGVKLRLFWGGNFYAHALPPARCWVIWDKETDGNFGDGEIAYCTADKSIRIFRHKWSGMLKASEKNERRVHPTQKPVALAEWAFGEFGAEVKSVLDLFLGSGSTLIACEKTGRICYGMELAPEYVDVIVKRWQEFTGKEAKLGDGPYKHSTFEQAKAGRLKASEDAIVEDAICAVG